MRQDGKHDRNCYVRGCELGADCAERKVDAREYQRRHRREIAERKAQMGKLKAVPTPADDELPRVDTGPRILSHAEYAQSRADTRDLGPVSAAIRAEIAAIPRAASDHPALSALAVSLGELVDTGDPLQRVAAAREIRAMLADLRPAKAADAGPSARDRLIESLSAAL